MAELNKVEAEEIDVRDLTALIQSELTSQENHTAIEMVRVNNDFFEKLEKRFPFLSEGDKQLCGYCLISLSSKDIAIIKGVQIKTVEMARYRLRKKLSIPRDSSISKFLQLLD